MTVAAAIAAVAPAGREEKHGSYVDADEKSHRRETVADVAAAAAGCHHRETSVAAAAVAAACHRRETSVAAAAVAAEACHRRETSVAVAAAAAAEACHRRETSVAAATAAAEACHRRETSVAVAAAAAAEACHRREIPYRRPENHGRRQEHGGGSMVPPAHPLPAIVSRIHGPCVESRRNGLCFLISGGSVGGRPKSLFSRHHNVPGAGGE